MAADDIRAAWFETRFALLTMRGEIATCDKFDTTGKSLPIFRNRVKPRNQKYFAFHVGQITGICRAILGPHEGRFAIVTMRRVKGCGGRFCSGAFFARETNERKRTAKSCGPGAAMLALGLWDFSAGDGDNKPAPPGRARSKP
jgi:hypothetical protein